MNEFMQDSVLFGTALTLVSYLIAVQIYRKVKLAIFNPLFISLIIAAAFLFILRIEPETYAQSAKYVTYFLSPATVCLAIPMYRHIKQLKENVAAVIAAVSVGALSSLAIIYFSNLLFSFPPELYNGILPKSVTTAIGLGISAEIGGLTSVTVTCICITGIFGNMILIPFCKLLRISDPISQGLAAGTSSHIIGTTKALELGEVQGALGSLSVVVCGIITVILAPFFAQTI